MEMILLFFNLASDASYCLFPCFLFSSDLVLIYMNWLQAIVENFIRNSSESNLEAICMKGATADYAQSGWLR